MNKTEKITITLLSLGNIGNLITFLNIFWFFNLTDRSIFDFFRGGNLGGQIIGILMLLGFIGIISFLPYLKVFISSQNKNYILLTINIVLLILWVISTAAVAQYL